ncbi:hypothetical protein C8R47DRAFT_1125319 [Mycena vitilis]|nr:hypothetical protein C8R47DRAFT_1125319 [Mycena vitilis]
MRFWYDTPNWDWTRATQLPCGHIVWCSIATIIFPPAFLSGTLPCNPTYLPPNTSHQMTDSIPSSSKIEPASFMFRTKPRKSKFIALAPITELDELEPTGGHDGNIAVLQDIHNTAESNDGPDKPLEMPLEILELPYVLPSRLTQMTPTIEFTSLCLATPASRPRSLRAVSNYFDSQNCNGGNTDGDCTRIPAYPRSPTMVIDPVVSEPQIRHSFRKRSREWEGADDEREDVKRQRTVPNHDPVAQTLERAGAIKLQQRRRNASPSPTAPSQVWPGRPLFLDLKSPPRKRLFEEVEQSADEIFMDQSRYIKRRRLES